MASLYARYILEKAGLNIVEIPEGFATYSFPNALTVYILDIYVLPEHRKGHIASKLADDICDLAKTKGCNRLLGSVMLNANKVNDSIAVLEAYGMKVCSITDETVFFEKGI